MSLGTVDTILFERKSKLVPENLQKKRQPFLPKPHSLEPRGPSQIFSPARRAPHYSLNVPNLERGSPQPEPSQVLQAGGEREGRGVDGGRGRVPQEEAAEGDRGRRGRRVRVRKGVYVSEHVFWLLHVFLVCWF